MNEKGTASAATLYTTMIQLVRERVYKFLSVDNMQAYTESTSGGKKEKNTCCMRNKKNKKCSIIFLSNR
jgi:hypothetical protein